MQSGFQVCENILERSKVCVFYVNRECEILLVFTILFFSIFYIIFRFKFGQNIARHNFEINENLGEELEKEIR